jgi:hypothetical protein
LANLVRARELESLVGPIAIVVGDEATYEQACLFAEVAELVRPIKVFREWHEARRWIDTAAANELRGVFDETVSGGDRPDGRQ